MAQKATVCKATLQIADIDRGLYADHALTVARHPSENDERMMVRLLAFALCVPADPRDGGLEFAKGMWDPDEPELWQKDLTGRIVQWIEVGQPEERRIAKASGRADRVSVFAFGNSAAAWWAGLDVAGARAGAKPRARRPGEPQHAAAGESPGRRDLRLRRRTFGADRSRAAGGAMSRGEAAAVGPQDVLDFWFGSPGSAEFGTQRKAWFVKDAGFDRLIVERFGPTIEQALRGELDAWSATPSGALARILLLDQFTRNAFRGDRRAFAGDPQALAAAIALVGSRQDESLPPVMRAFAYLPFEHAESLAMQDESLRLFTRLAATSPEHASALDYAHRHRAVIERFGRFPHRNALLGRQSTAEERVHIATPGTAF